MNDDELKSVIENAGDEMPATTKARVASAISAGFRGEAPSQRFTDDASSDAESVVVPLEAGSRTPRRTPKRWIAIGGVVPLAAALIGVFALRNDHDVAEVTDTVPVETTTTVPPVQTATSAVVTESTETATTETATTETPPSETPPSKTPPSDTPTTATSTTEAPTTGPPASVQPESVGLPANVVPTSVSFPTSSNGWMVGRYEVDDTPNAPGADSTAQTVLLHTTDAGRTWTEVDHPLGLTSDASAYSIAFADELNGWLAGPIVDGVRPVLLTTHDGALTWSRTLGPAAMAWSPMTVASGNGLVSVVAFDDQQTLGVFTAAIDSDTFVRSPVVLQPAAGPVYDVTIALGGESGWLVYNDRVLSGAARLVGGEWVDWQTPCSTEDPSKDVAEVAATGDGSTVVVACTTSGFAEPPASVRIFASADGGETFDETQPVENGTQQAGLQAGAPSVSFLAAPARDVVLVGYTRNDGELVINRSVDAGGTWSATQHIPQNQVSSALFEFAAPYDGSGTIVVETSPGTGYQTKDAGATWHLFAASAVPDPP